jgi:copper chaperone CopZ
MARRLQEISIEVRGMAHAGDAALVSDALARVAGVVRAAASVAEQAATVTADPDIATAGALRDAIVTAGFRAGDLRFPE